MSMFVRMFFRTFSCTLRQGQEAPLVVQDFCGVPVDLGLDGLLAESPLQKRPP